MITGRVYDAETKEPLAKAFLFESAAILNDQQHKVQFGGNVRTDDAGNFTVLAARPGRYELRFNDTDYLPKNVIVDIAEDDGSKQADFAVERGTAQALVLRWPDGAPIPGATVYDGDALRIVAVDSDGKPSGGIPVLRLNGELIPLEIVMRRYGPFAVFDAAGERVLDRHPPGAYDVWLVRDRNVPLSPEPAARAGISTGEERVRVVVPKR